MVFPNRTYILILGIILSLIIVCSAHAGKPQDTLTLLQYLTSSDAEIAGKASVELLKRSDQVSASVIRIAAATAAWAKAHKAVPFLVDLLLDQFVNEESGAKASFDATTRAVCSLALGKIITLEERDGELKPRVKGSVVEAMIMTLSKEYPFQIRAASAWSLQYTFSSKAIVPLDAIVKDEKEDSIIKLLAAQSLTKISQFEHHSPPSIPGSWTFVTPDMILTAQAELLLQFGNIMTHPKP